MAELVAMVFNKAAARVTGMATGLRRRRVWAGFLLLLPLLVAASASGQTRPAPALQVVMDDNYPPFVFKGGDGRLQGILVDQWQLWEKKTGIPVVIYAMDWSEALRRMKAGEFDVIDTIFQTKKRGDWLDFTKAYARIEVPIYFRKDIAGIADVNSLKGFAVGAKEGDAAADLLARQGVGHLLLFNNYEHIITAAKERKVNVFVVDEPPALYFLNKLGLQDEFRCSAPVNVGEFHRPVKKGNAALLATVENGFALISPSELAAIDKKWRGTATGNPAGWKRLGYAALGGLALLLLLTAWNWSLNRQVRRRVAALKRSEAALSKSGAQIQLIIDNTRDTIFQIDLQGNYIFGNAAAEQMTGYPLAQLLQMNMWQLVPPEYHPLLKDRLRRRITGETMEKNFEFEIQHRDGHRVWMELATSGVYSPEGKLMSIQGVARDITERKAYEEQLAQSVSLLRATIESGTSGLLVVNLQGKVTICNDRFLEMWGIPAELAAQADAALFQKFAQKQLQEPEAFLRCVQEIYRQPETESHDTLQLKDGRIVDRVSRPQRLGDKIIGRVWNFRDVTERRLADKTLRESRDNLNRAQAVAKMGSWQLDIPRNILKWSAETHRIFEVPADRPLTLDAFTACIHPDDLEKVRAAWDAALHGAHYDIEHRILCGDKIKWVRKQAEVVFDSAGKPREGIGTVQDITEHRQAEAALESERQLLRTMIDLAPDFIFIKDTESRFLVANDSLAKCYRRTPAEMLGHTDAEFVPAVLATRFRRSEQEVITTGTLHSYEDTICFPDGITRTVVTNMVAFRDPHGKIAGLIGIGRDITGQKATEKSMRLQSVSLNAAANTVVITDAQGNIEWANPAFTLTTGYTLAEALGRNPRDLISSGKHEPEFFRRMWQTILAGEVWTGEVINRRKNGELFDEEMTITPLLDDDKNITHFIAIKQDITRRRQAEEALRESEHRLQQMAASLQEAVWLRDTGTRKILYVNPAFEQITGHTCEEFYQKHSLVLDLIHPDDREAVLQAWDASFQTKAFDVQHRIIRADGRVRWVQGRMFPVRNAAGEIHRAATTLADITDQVEADQAHRNLEIQLRQSQKMEAIGQLSGGIAHDFNNILTVIQGNAALLLGFDLSAEEIRDCSDQIARAGERAAGLTRQLLMFARKQQMQPVPLDLNETALHMTKMLQRILGEDIALRSEYSPALPLIQADAGMVEQIILNLAVNARDAMPDGGRLTIRTLVESPQAGATAPTHVCLAIADTGTGIAPEILPRIFEPFFTTKEVGKGTGLGLATVYGIVQQHHGEISVQSEPGKGTAFKVYFPIATTPAPTSTEIARRQKLAGGSETILLVEDETPLRTFVSELLQRCGYTVLEADTGPSALEIWKHNQDRIHLLFTDVIMPENINGIELGRRLRAEKPGLKVIYTSGHTGNVEGRHTALIEGFNFIRKPFKPEAIAEIIRKNLDEKTAGN
jgi:nitrogen fixation negative regulator NifL